MNKDTKEVETKKEGMSKIVEIHEGEIILPPWIDERHKYPAVEELDIIVEGEAPPQFREGVDADPLVLQQHVADPQHQRLHIASRDRKCPGGQAPLPGR